MTGDHEPTESIETAAPTSGEGNLISAPNLNGTSENASVGASSRTSSTDRKAMQQLLTSGADRVLETAKPSLSPAKLTWRELRKNRLAIIGLWTLVFLYSVALFAPFLAPYNPIDQNPGGRNETFHPPMKLRFSGAPFVYQMQSHFDQDRNLIYLPDANQPTKLRFFMRGWDYKLFGLFPTDVHLYGGDNGPVFLLGTDQFGRDYLSRLLAGSQISLSVGLIAIAITFTLGMLVGGISGFYGGVLDDLIMRGCEILMSIPDFYLLLALAAALPVDWDPFRVYLLIIVILSLIGWAGMARVVRGMVLSVREREYVEAARALGVSDFKIIVRHILPSTFTFAIVAATMSIPGYILAEAGLSFLGLGIRDPMASWGNMLTAAQDLNTLENQRWILAPAVAIFITTLAFNFLGDGLRDALDPKSRKLG